MAKEIKPVLTRDLDEILDSIDSLTDEVEEMKDAIKAIGYLLATEYREKHPHDSSITDVEKAREDLKLFGPFTI